MICTKCREGLTRAEYPKPGEEFWNQARMNFIASHAEHNPKWGRSWKNSLSKKILNLKKYDKTEIGQTTANRLVELYRRTFREEPNWGLKV